MTEGRKFTANPRGVTDGESPGYRCNDCEWEWGDSHTKEIFVPCPRCGSEKRTSLNGGCDGIF